MHVLHHCYLSVLVSGFVLLLLGRRGGEAYPGKGYRCSVSEAGLRECVQDDSDRLLLGMEWKGRLFIDTAFGLRSAPKVLTAVADALMWIFRKYGGVQGFTI